MKTALSHLSGIVKSKSSLSLKRRTETSSTSHVPSASNNSDESDIPATTIIPPSPGPRAAASSSQENDLWSMSQSSSLNQGASGDPQHLSSPALNSNFKLVTSTPSTDSVQEYGLSELTLMEAFGAQAPTLLKMSDGDLSAAQNNNATRLSRINRTSRRNTSDSESRPASVFDRDIKQMMEISMSQAGMIDVNSLPAPSVEHTPSKSSEKITGEPRSILKNADIQETGYVPPNFNSGRRRSFHLPDKFSERRRASLDIGGSRSVSCSRGSSADYATRISQSQRQESTQSIMAALAGKGAEEDHPQVSESEREALERETPIFEALLRESMEKRRYRAGEYIIRKHDMGHEMFLLLEGKVEILASDGRTKFSTVNPGAFFGMLCIG